jgi:hypothetical protein
MRIVIDPRQLGKTPLSCFQDLRVERAVHLWHRFDRRAGRLSDGATLRALLRRKIGRTVSELHVAY